MASIRHISVLDLKISAVRKLYKHYFRVSSELQHARPTNLRARVNVETETTEGVLGGTARRVS